jgi:hypothetical protein
VARYAAKHSWIVLHRLSSEHDRDPAAPVAQAFNTGLGLVPDQDFEFVVKLDCDVELSPDYFERMLHHFEEDPSLGIASGIYVEQAANGEWTPVPMPVYHACGASKVMRKACFNDIGSGFAVVRGWDTLDEIQAQVLGWKTRHFPDLVFQHLKPEGSGAGFLVTNIMHGEIYYLTGGGPLFLAFKVLHRICTGRPRVVGGLALAFGYLRFMILGKKRIVTPEQARYYRRLLTSRLFAPVRNLFQSASAQFGVTGDVRD